MSQQEKGALYKALQAEGVEFSKHYREYTTEELRQSYDALAAAGEVPPRHTAAIETEQAPPPTVVPVEGSDVRQRDPNEMAGQRQNTHAEDEPLRTDPETGVIWYQEEVLKSAMAKPRGRRVLKYNDSGSKTETVQSGDYEETFEVAGDQKVASEVKVTLPSYQVGIFKDPRFPFKTHTYDGQQGFNLFEVEDYFGGAELVPDEVKRKYISNDLCYDIRTVVRAIESEYRQLQLAGKV